MEKHTPEVKLQNADALAAGYSGWYRAVEIFSIVAFWALSAGIVYRLSFHFHDSPWLLVAAFLSGFIMADWVSGFVHWLGDTWGRTDMPILGAALIRPFREHHVDQKAITRHDYVETNGSNCMISVPVAAMMFAMPLHRDSDWYWLQMFVMASNGSMIFWVMMTNQFHKWAHSEESERPAWATWAQRLHLILPPDHHRIHHAAPFAKYYCITTGWLNWPLNKLHFYRIMERTITAISGAIPRKDDIGEKAAIAVAEVPLVVGLEDEQQHQHIRS